MAQTERLSSPPLRPGHRQRQPPETGHGSYLVVTEFVVELLVNPLVPVVAVDMVKPSVWLLAVLVVRMGSNAAALRPPLLTAVV